jgi:hypothetical protein
MTPFTCPCCGHAMGYLPNPKYIRDKLSAREGQIFTILLDRPEGILFPELVSLIGRSVLEKRRDPDGQSLRVSLHHLRRKITAYGYHIPKTGQKRLIRLLPLEVGPNNEEPTA